MPTEGVTPLFLAPTVLVVDDELEVVHLPGPSSLTFRRVS
jgi:hypothetical protein